MNSEETFSKTLLLLFMKHQSFLQNTTTFSQHLFQAQHKKYCWAPGSIISDPALWQQGEWLQKKKVLSQLTGCTEIPKIKWLIMCPSVPSDSLVALANIGTYENFCQAPCGFIQMRVSTHPLTEGQHNAARLFCTSCGDEHVPKAQTGPGAKNRSSVCFYRSTHPWVHWYSPSATKSIGLSP